MLDLTDYCWLPACVRRRPGGCYLRGCYGGEESRSQRVAVIRSRPDVLIQKMDDWLWPRSMRTVTSPSGEEISSSIRHH